MKRALCVGINDYPGYINDLRGCVADAKAWSGLLVGQFNFEPPLVLLDSMATINNVKSALAGLIAKSQPGDVLVWTYSGHGTSIPGARPDKPDGRAEAICLHDGLLLDSQIRTILATIPNGVHTVVISDSCHSGTVTRMVRKAQFMDNPTAEFQPRYYPPDNNFFAEGVASFPITGRLLGLTPETQMKEILISGCAPTETSADACIQPGSFMGALSYNAINILKQNPNLTYAEFYSNLRKCLPSHQYPQTPQLEGSPENKSKKVFN